MSSASSFTAWIDQIKSGDGTAIQKLWESYFPRLVGLAQEATGNATPRHR